MKKIVKDVDKLSVPGIDVKPDDYNRVDRLLRLPMLTYLKDKAVGLAHSQINFNDEPNLRAFAVKMNKTDVIKVFMNPVVNDVILDGHGKVIRENKPFINYERCLSVSGQCETKRVNSVTIEGKDYRGKELFMSLNGIDAIVAQHEMDHINGILIKNKCYCDNDCIESDTLMQGGKQSCSYDPRWHC